MHGRTVKGPGRKRLVRWAAPMFLVALALAATLAPQASAKHSRVNLHCTIVGTSGDDRLVGTPGKDVICGRGGDDRIAALRGNDYVFGAGGNDHIDGGPGSDHLFGATGNDRIRGGAGPDFLYGEEGNDRLAGGPAADAMYGDLGNDHLVGDDTDQISGGDGTDVGDPYDASDAPQCPSTADFCQIHIHLDVTLPCPSFTKSFGACIGMTRGSTNTCWTAIVALSQGFSGGFSWGGDRPKFTNYVATRAFIPFAGLEGRVPGPERADFSISRAFCLTSGNFDWRTPDRPGVPPGKLGGPLYLNFVNGIIGADMYMDGFLFRSS